jgi:hypothetical protein
MVSSITGSQNTAVGVSALRNNTAGGANVAIGQDTCKSNGSATFNTGVGWEALAHNTANDNTAVGASALFSNATGGNNTATGFQALKNSTGNFNNGFGRNALVSLASGDGNVAIGDSALANAAIANNNVAIGNSTLTNVTTGDYNIALGFFSGASLSGAAGNNIDIGNPGFAHDFDTIRIGNDSHIGTYIAAIWDGAMNENAVIVGVDDTDKVGDHIESASRLRFKDVFQDHKKIAELEAVVVALAAQLKEQSAQLQKATAQVEINKPIAKVALNNP